MDAPFFRVSAFVCKFLTQLPASREGCVFLHAKLPVVRTGKSLPASSFRLADIKGYFSTPARNRILTRISLIVWFLLLANCQSAVGQDFEAAGTRTISKARGPIVVPDCRIHVVNEVSLACERSGILDFAVAQGGFVKQGEVIARLRDSIARASYAIAEQESANDVEIRFAKKASQLAQLKYERAQQADQALSGTVTEFELRKLRLAAERSLLQHQQAEHQFAVARLKQQEQLELLNSYQITAPFDAFVRATHKKPGEYVREGEVVLEIVNDGVIRVDGHVDLRDLPYVAAGNQVAINLPQSGGEPVTFRGAIKFVDTKIEPVSMKAFVSAEIQNANSILKDGLLVTMAIAATEPSPESYK